MQYKTACQLNIGLLLCLLLPLAAWAGKPLDPRAVVLPTYLLPDTAAVDGRLDDWARIPAVPAESFKLNLENETITGSSDFAPSLRCGMKRGSSDLYFLVLVRDSQLRAEDSNTGLAGDCLEFYIDAGREERDIVTPDWYKVPYTNAYYPRQEPPRPLGQFVVRPPTLQGPAKLFKSPNAEKWRMEFACTLVEGGVAYELRLRTDSMLKDLQMAKLPSVFGIDIGFIDQDFAPRLHAENWANDDGLFRLFGDWVDDMVLTHYGRVTTTPIPVPVEQAADPLPKPLNALFGESPTAVDLRKALGRLSPERMADLVTWAGMQGLVFDPALVKLLMASSSAAVCEACMAVLAFADQDTPAIRAGLDATYAAPQSPYVLSLANVLSQRLGYGPADRFRPLLMHEEPTVAFTAAAALARVGDAGDLTRLDAACDARCAALTAGPPVRDTGYHQWYAGKGQRASAVRYFIGIAREALQLRVEPVTIPASPPVRQLLTANTDLERFMPIDGNNVYNAKGLLRRWPANGPRELWRITVGQGKGAVVEAGGRAFTVALGEKQQWAVCLDPKTGQTLWRKSLAADGVAVPEIVASPVVDGDRVYFVPARFAQEEGLTIVCLKAADGSEVWRGRDELEHIASCPTPLIVGDLLYCPLFGGKDPLPVCVAVDKLTGKIIWRSPIAVKAPGRKCGSGIASPSYQVIDGIGQIILSVYSSPVNEIWGLDAKTGEFYWKYPANAHYAMIPSPVAAGSRVFLSDGLPPFSACLQMYVRDGKIKARQLYHDDRNQCNQYNTVAVLNDCVYGFSNSTLQCTRLSDGKLLWKHEDRDWGSGPQLIVADNLIFALGTFNLVLAEATPTGYRELGRVRHNITLGYPQQPTLANGRLYLRGDTEIVCYDVLKQ